MKFSSLKQQLLVTILGMSALIFGITILAITIINQKTAIETTKSLTNSRLKEMSMQILWHFEKPLETVRNLRNSFIGLREKSNKNREYYKALIQNAFIGNSDYLAVWTMWESNALDGNDKDYILHKEYSENGRFSYSCYSNNGEILEELDNSENDYNENYYRIPFDTGKEVVLEPYFYSYLEDNSNPFFETSVAIPIIYKGERLGVMGIDLDLKKLSEIISHFKVTPGSWSILISNSGLIAAHQDTSYLSKKFIETLDFIDQNVLNAIQNDQPLFFEAYSKKLQTTYYVAIEPLKVGSSLWGLCTIIPEKEALSAVNKLMANGLILGFVGLLLLSVVIFYQSNQIIHPIQNTIAFSKTVARGDLTRNIEEDRVDEIGSLQRSLNLMVSKLNEIIKEISNAVDCMQSSSGDLSSSSQQISQQANAQAASLEEISSTLEELLSGIAQNTDNAAEANAISSRINDNLAKVSAASEDSLNSVKEITEKIKIITDIAFQTNILALNAAVEAARVGEHGKGFAVVAFEVRKLAERSRKAADEIVFLASKSLQATENSALYLNQLIPEIQKTSQLVQEISAASKEQHMSSEQIGKSLTLLNNVAQQNAAASEELATNAEELNALSDQLKDLVHIFRVD